MTEIAPWLNPPAEEIAPWLKEQPGYVEDMAKAAPSGLAKGVIGLAGTGGDLSHIVKAGSDKATEKGWNPFSFLAQKFEDTKLGQFLKKESAPYQSTRASGDLPGSYELPTSADLKKEAEKITGPLYDAKTGPGKAFQTALEVTPALATGPVGGLRGLAAKSAGAGIVSELAGEGAEATKGYLPKGAQPWAEPVARAVGAGAGMFTPSGVRRAITPLPMTDEQFATVNALRARDPNFPMSAGQATESPRLMNLEARTTPMQGMGERQERAFTEGAMRESGIPSNDFRNIHQGEAVGQELGSTRRANNMNSPEFNTLLRTIGQEKRDASRVAGRGKTPSLDEVQNDVKFGAMNNGTPVLNMPGARYEHLRGDIQRRIDGAANPTERNALSRIRDQLDASYKASVPADVAERLTQLESQYANYNVLKNVPPKVGRETVTPQEVLSSVGKNWGNAAANEGRGTLAPYAQDASRVMTPHPPKPDQSKVPPSVDLLISALTGAATAAPGEVAGLGHAMSGIMGGEGAVLGHLLAPSLYHLPANVAAKVASSRPSQAYLQNQTWRPGASSTTERDQLLRLLMAPTESQLVTGQ